MKETNQRQLWPKTPLQWLGVLVLLFLAYSAWEAAINTTRDPFPEGTRANERLERSIENLRRAQEEADRNR